VRHALQETELRTLKAAAEDVAGKFDAAVAALAAKRLDILAEVSHNVRTSVDRNCHVSAMNLQPSASGS